jgi:hypothetical protein
MSRQPFISSTNSASEKLVASESERPVCVENCYDFQSAMNKLVRYFVDLFVKLPIVVIQLTIIIPILLVFGIIYLLKYSMYLVLRKIYPKEKCFTMSINDTFFYYGHSEHEKANESIIMSTLYLRKNIEKENLDKMLEGIKIFPRFVSVPQSSYFGFCEFVQYPDMNVSQHTTQYRVSSNQINDEVEKIRGKKMNFNIPWWDVTILNVNETNENIKKEYESIVIFRFHHIIGDGMSIVSNLIPILFTDSQNEPIHLNWNHNWNKSKPFQFRIESLFLIIEALWKVLTDGYFTDSLMYKKKPGVAKNEKFYSKSMPINLVKKIKNHEKCNFSSVVVSAFAGALRRFSIENEHLNVHSINQGNYRTFMIMGYPISGQLGNTFSVISMPIYLNIKNSFERLKLTQNEIIKMKNGYMPYLMKMFGDCVSLLGSTVNQKILGSLFDKHTTMISTLPIIGVDQSYFCGAQVINIEAHVKNAMLPFPEITTFEDKITINMSCDQSIFHKIEQICSYFQSELEQMNINMNIKDIKNIND